MRTGVQGIKSFLCLYFFIAFSTYCELLSQQFLFISGDTLVNCLWLVVDRLHSAPEGFLLILIRPISLRSFKTPSFGLPKKFLDLLRTNQTDLESLMECSSFCGTLLKSIITL